MALLDSISLYTNVTKIGKWANGKYGEILPTEQNTHIFIEFEDRNGSLCYKYTEEERNAKAPVLAYGFVNHWLRNRKRKTVHAERLDLCPPKGGYKIPKEIYDSYIDARKKWFVETMKNRADAWKYPDLEKLFYERNLTAESENELVVKSEPLLEYLDDEDKEEMSFILKNFFEYLNHILKPYQHNMGNDIEYSIESPEILDCAKKLEPIQVEILSQLVINNNQIKTWQENPVLNQYSEKEIYEAASDLRDKGLISGLFDRGCASYLKLKDNGKLVLRKYEMLQEKDDSTKVLPEEIAIPEDNSSNDGSLKVRIEVLNFIMSELGKNSEWINNNRRGEAMKRLYKFILEKGTDRIIKENIGRAKILTKNEEHVKAINYANQCLHDIDSNWKIEL